MHNHAVRLAARQVTKRDGSVANHVVGAERRDLGCQSHDVAKHVAIEVKCHILRCDHNGKSLPRACCDSHRAVRLLDQFSCACVFAIEELYLVGGFNENAETAFVQ